MLCVSKQNKIEVNNTSWYIAVYLFIIDSYTKYKTADLIAVFVNKHHGIQRRGQDRKFVFKEVHSKEVDRRIS